MDEETVKSSQTFEINVPTTFLGTIDQYIENAQFASRNEFVRMACRFYMEKHKLPFIRFPKP